MTGGAGNDTFNAINEANIAAGDTLSVADTLDGGAGIDTLNITTLKAGTVIIFDEYINNKSWREDEFKAFQEWVAANDVQYEYIVASFFTKQVAVQILGTKD